MNERENAILKEIANWISKLEIPHDGGDWEFNLSLLHEISFSKIGKVKGLAYSDVCNVLLAIKEMYNHKNPQNP